MLPRHEAMIGFDCIARREIEALTGVENQAQVVLPDVRVDQELKIAARTTMRVARWRIHHNPPIEQLEVMKPVVMTRDPIGKLRLRHCLGGLETQFVLRHLHVSIGPSLEPVTRLLAYSPTASASSDKSTASF